MVRQPATLPSSCHHTMNRRRLPPTLPRPLSHPTCALTLPSPRIASHRIAWSGVNLWPFLVEAPQPSNCSAAHPEGLWLSEQVIVFGEYKLVVAQQDPVTTNSGPTLGWKCGGAGHPRCDTTTSADCGENPDTKGPATPQCNTWVNATAEQCKCGCAFTERDHFVPCLFNVETVSVPSRARPLPTHPPAPIGVTDQSCALALSRTSRSSRISARSSRRCGRACGRCSTAPTSSCICITT
jgi:hypothetical protein